MKVRQLFGTVALLLTVATARATFNYEYNTDEYVAISEGISPDGHLVITAHGEGEYGYDHFRLYLFEAASGKKIGPLEEVSEVLDTGAGAFGARWSKDSTEATIVYRVDRHAPFKAMTYRFAKGRAVPTTRRPVDVHDEALEEFWGKYCSDSRPPARTFGHPKPPRP